MTFHKKIVLLSDIILLKIYCLITVLITYFFCYRRPAMVARGTVGPRRIRTRTPAPSTASASSTPGPSGTTRIEVVEWDGCQDIEIINWPVLQNLRWSVFIRWFYCHELDLCLWSAWAFGDIENWGRWMRRFKTDKHTFNNVWAANAWTFGDNKNWGRWMRRLPRAAMYP